MTCPISPYNMIHNVAIASDLYRLRESLREFNPRGIAGRMDQSGDQVVEFLVRHNQMVINTCQNTRAIRRTAAGYRFKMSFQNELMKELQG